MYVNIEQRKWSFSSKYDIHTTDGSYYAEKNLFSLKDRLKIYAPNNQLLAKLNSSFFIFRPKYKFELFNSKTYDFTCEKLWKGVFNCEGNGEKYKLYRHKKRDYSIFQDEVQIAAFKKEKISIGKGDIYHIRMNDDANFALMICLVLTMDSSENEDNNDSHTVTLDFGNFGPEEQPFDESWEPNQS